jgi:hypothetical protein
MKKTKLEFHRSLDVMEFLNSFAFHSRNPGNIENLFPKIREKSI